MSIANFFPTAVGCGVVLALQCAAFAQEGDIDGDELVKLLTSPLDVEKEAGEKMLHTDGERLFDQALSGLESDDLGEVANSAERIKLYLSPWQRGMARSTLHRGSMNLGYPERPTQLPVNHPRAAQCATALLEAFERSLKTHPLPTRHDQWMLRLEVSSHRASIGSSLSEVADRDTLDRLATILGTAEDIDLITILVRVFEGSYGWPWTFQRGGICGNSTREEVQMFEKEQMTNSKNAAKKMVGWHTRFRDQPPAVFIEAALSEFWAEMFQEPGGIHHSVSVSSGAWTGLSPLVRHGETVVPLIEKRMAATGDLGVKGNCALVLTTITGGVDADLIRQLLASDDAARRYRHAELACEIIAAGRSTKWIQELDALQYLPFFKHRTASRALAICHRNAAIPYLEKALAADPENYTAEYAIKELNAWDE